MVIMIVAEHDQVDLGQIIEADARLRHALGAMGFEGVNGVRQGKVIELDLNEGATKADVEAMCEKLLANTVIESYTVEMS